MSRIIQSMCPGCQRAVRVPVDWLEQSVRCKFCGTYSQIRKREGAPAAMAFTPGVLVATAFVPPVEQAPSAMPWTPTDTSTNVPAPVPYTPNTATPGLGWGQPATAQVPYTPNTPAPTAGAYTPNVPVPQATGDFDMGHQSTFLENANTNSGKPYRRKQGNSKTILLLGGFCFMLTAAVVVLGLFQAGVFNVPKDGDPKGVVQTSGGENKNGKTPDGKEGTPVAQSTSPFPRRLFSINVANYLYANPIHNGAARTLRAGDQVGGGVTAVIKQISDKWRIPKDQIFELSDSLLGTSNRVPLKKIIEDSLYQFVETSRPQDRIVILYTGHAVMVEGKGYLVPIEGEIEDPKTLIPLDWVYDQLKSCKAQQKLVIFDVCRYDPGRGFERPSGGQMSEELAKLLQSPPEGVQTWTACSTGQYSYEYDYAAQAGYELRGSVFLSNFFFASSKGKLGKGIQKPDEPLPMEPLIEAVNERTQVVVKDLEKADQTPKLSGTMSGTQVPYNPLEAPAKKIEIPLPPEGADKAEIAAIVREMLVPSIKTTRKDVVVVPLERVVPFPQDVLKDYKEDDGVTEEMILQNPDKYPLRFETLLTLRLLRDLRDATNDKEQDLPEEFQGESSDAAKAQILALQRLPARIQSLLERRLTQMEIAKEYRELEKNKRWLAHFDFALAQLAMRFVYLNEYNLMLGKVRKDELPPLDMTKGHKGWRLAANEKMASGKEIRDKAAEAKELLEGLIKNHPNTPWAVFAKRERSTSLGLQWQASNFGRE